MLDLSDDEVAWLAERLELIVEHATAEAVAGESAETDLDKAMARRIARTARELLAS